MGVAAPAEVAEDGKEREQAEPHRGEGEVYTEGLAHQGLNTKQRQRNRPQDVGDELKEGDSKEYACRFGSEIVVLGVHSLSISAV